MSKNQNAMPRLKLLYEEKIKPELMKQFAYKNVMQIPKLEKIVLSMGVSGAVADRKKLTKALDEMTLIAGQKAVATKAKNSIAQFKLREGMPIGCKVTLRGSRMYEFLDRFLNIAMPRIKDFRGVSPKNFDGNGNFSVGVNEQIIFPEIDYDSVDEIRGMNVAIVTTAKTDDESRAMLKSFGVPFNA